MTPTLLTVALTATALVGATISGIIGMAGGAFLLGLMLMFGLAPAVVVPVHSAVQLISNVTRVIAHLPNVQVRPFLVLAVTAAPCPIFGLWLLQFLEPNVVRALMGCAILYATWAPKWGVQKLSMGWRFAIAGVLGGSLGVIVGAVGPLIAPFFLGGGFRKEQIIATKALCQAYLHILKIIAFTSVGFAFPEHLDWILPMGAAAIVGTYVGKWVLSRMSEKHFVGLYKVVLTALAARLLLWNVF